MAALLKDFANGVALSLHADSNFQIFILKMSAADNRFNPSFCASLQAALDHIKSALSACQSDSRKFALIVTGDGKFFSNGLDLKYLRGVPSPNQFLIDHYEPLISNFLTFPLPTVAHINGHAFAGGMCLALALDYRLALETNAKPPLLSMNELLIRASIPAGMLAVLRAKLPSPNLLRDCIYARRWTSHDAHQDGIIDALSSSDTEIIEFAKSKAIEAKFAPVLESIKRETYREASGLLLDPKSDKLDPFRFALPRNKL